MLRHIPGFSKVPNFILLLNVILFTIFIFGFGTLPGITYECFHCHCWAGEKLIIIEYERSSHDAGAEESLLDHKGFCKTTEDISFAAKMKRDNGLGKF